MPTGGLVVPDKTYWLTLASTLAGAGVRFAVAWLNARTKKIKASNAEQ